MRLAPAASPRDLPADALLLVPPDAEDATGVPRARILLLLGAGDGVERHDLLVPPPRLEAMHAALRDAAETLAGSAGGRWLARALAISGDMASVALLPEDAQAFRPPLSVLAAALVHDLPTPAGSDGLDLGDARRVRLLLGMVPTGLRAFVRGDASGAALFGNGRRLPTILTEHPSGEACIEAEPWPGADAAAVIGLAVPRTAARLVLTRLELLP